jgi:hypothetical protein
MALEKYELTEEGKKYGVKEGKPKGSLIILPSNTQGDPHFQVYGGRIQDYHCEEILKRKDGKGARFVRLKTVNKSLVEKKK